MEKGLYSLESYDYNLPKELIAQTPVEPRDSSRLLVLHKDSGKIEHKIFKNIENYIEKGDVLIINNTKVIPARIKAKKETGANIEVFLTERLEENIWRAMVKPGRRVKTGNILLLEKDHKIEVLKHLDDGTRIIKFLTGKDIDIINKIGNIPLPPYITEYKGPLNRYQTIFAQKNGSVAAPTAGLHFTPSLLKRLEDKGVLIKEVTLHVGVGTFKPVQTEDIRKHKMHKEYYVLPEDTIKAIKTAKQEGKRIFAVGTTTVRVLEHSFRNGLENIKPHQGSTNLFIYPGFEFKVVDALITNFHMPKSTLLMLVAAFAGYKNIMQAYKEAVRLKYRFLSFGDAMLII